MCLRARCRLVTESTHGDDRGASVLYVFTAVRVLALVPPGRLPSLPWLRLSACSFPCACGRSLCLSYEGYSWACAALASHRSLEFASSRLYFGTLYTEVVSKYQEITARCQVPPGTRAAIAQCLFPGEASSALGLAHRGVFPTPEIGLEPCRLGKPATEERDNYFGRSHRADPAARLKSATRS